MKIVIKVVLGIAAVVMAYFCYQSINAPIAFQNEKDAREKQVIAALINIRKAETEFKNQNGKYTASFDTLITFLKTAKMKTVKKEGELTDAQLEHGMTEAKALAIVRSGNAKLIAENGLQNFRRDTVYDSVLKALFAGVYDEKTIDNIRKIPFSNGKEFELQIGSQEKNSIVIPLFEARAPYETYLQGMDKRQIKTMEDDNDDYNRYNGLKVGDAVEPNNNAGNWES
jgi:hypothetical protein